MGGFFSWLFSSPSKYDTRQIKRGFTKEQVRQIFGRPKSVTDGILSAETWTYAVPFRIYATVDFDGDGKVQRTYRSGEPVD